MAYIQIDRKLFCHFLWTEQRSYSKFEAWLDLIQLVSYSDKNENIINGVLVEWSRGEFPVSYSFLSQRWNWTAQRTRGYMHLLKINKQINIRIVNRTTILTLCNYEQYNPKQQGDNKVTTGPTTTSQQGDNKATTIIKEDNTVNTVIEEKKKRVKKDFTPPSPLEVELYFQENGYKKESAEKAFNYYNCANWVNSKGKQVLNWKQTMQGVWFKEENKIKEQKPKFVF